MSIVQAHSYGLCILTCFATPVVHNGCTRTLREVIAFLLVHILTGGLLCRLAGKRLNVDGVTLAPVPKLYRTKTITPMGIHARIEAGGKSSVNKKYLINPRHLLAALNFSCQEEYPESISSII